MQKVIVLALLLAVVARILTTPGKKIPMRPVRCDCGEGL
jgi:hypothetical protein